MVFNILHDFVCPTDILVLNGTGCLFHNTEEISNICSLSQCNLYEISDV